MKHVTIIFFFGVMLTAPLQVLASETNGTINATNKYAWSNQAGWVNFGATNGGIAITDSGITGYAWNANYGWINMAPTNGGVTVAASGTLSGYAWGAGLGWVNFSGVSINSSGRFIGQASGVIIGTLTFDCINCNVTTDYRPIDFRSISSSGSGSSSSGSAGSSSGEGGSSTVPGTGRSDNVDGDSDPSSPRSGAVTDTQFGFLPAQLLDIRLILDDAKVARAIDVVARVIFESFGRVPTKVELTFVIQNVDGETVWSGKDELVVETEEIFVKRFSDIGFLPPGEYRLTLRTLYNETVEDEFGAPFVIAPIETLSSHWIWYVIGALALLLALLLLIVWIRRRKEKENTLRGLKTPYP